MSNKTNLQENFQIITFTKKYDSLFWNTIKDLEYREIQFEKPVKNGKSIISKAYRIKLSPKEVENIAKYANGLKFVKEQSSECIDDGKKTSYEKEIPYYLQGFIAEYAFIKFGLHLGLKVTWRDHLVSHGKGDDGDARINDTIIDIKSKNYKVPYHSLHYDVTTPGKSSYFVFTYVENQEDGSVYVDILGYHSLEYIKSVEKKEYWSPGRRRSYKARRIEYPTLNSIESFFNLTF